jgi:hypothetical protein
MRISLSASSPPRHNFVCTSAFLADVYSTSPHSAFPHLPSSRLAPCIRFGTVHHTFKSILFSIFCTVQAQSRARKKCAQDIEDQPSDLGARPKRENVRMQEVRSQGRSKRVGDNAHHVHHSERSSRCKCAETVRARAGKVWPTMHRRNDKTRLRLPACRPPSMLGRARRYTRHTQAIPPPLM